MKYVMTLLASLLVVTTLVTVPACAARGAKNKAQVAAMTIGQAVQSLRDAEEQVYRFGITGYGETEHRASLVKIRDVTIAAQAYERAAAAWPDGASMPADLLKAQQGLSAALDSLVKVVPAVEQVRVPLIAAITAVRTILLSQAPQPVQSQLPPIDLAEIQVLFALAGTLISGIRTVRARLGMLGVSPEQLATLDAQLTAQVGSIDDEIAAIDAHKPPTS